MSIQKTHDLPLGGSVKKYTFASKPTVGKSKAQSTRPGGQEEPKKFDWFLILLYFLVAVGITAISVLMFMFLTPSQPAPLP
jgi:hypothetical protein